MRRRLNAGFAAAVDRRQPRGGTPAHGFASGRGHFGSPSGSFRGGRHVSPARGSGGSAYRGRDQYAVMDEAAEDYVEEPRDNYFEQGPVVSEEQEYEPLPQDHYAVYEEEAYDEEEVQYGYGDY